MGMSGKILAAELKAGSGETAVKTGVKSGVKSDVSASAKGGKSSVSEAGVPLESALLVAMYRRQCKNFL